MTLDANVFHVAEYLHAQLDRSKSMKMKKVPFMPTMFKVAQVAQEYKDTE